MPDPAFEALGYFRWSLRDLSHKVFKNIRRGSFWNPGPAPI